MSRITKFKLAAIDIDDTLLGPDRKVSAANAAPITRLRGRGVRVVLASGRSHTNMIRFHHALELGEGPVVSNHGALVRGATDDSLWFQELTPAGPLASATIEGLSRGFSVVHYRHENVFTQGHSEWTEKLQSRAVVPFIVVPDLLWTRGEGVLKAMWLDEPEVISRLAAEIKASYAGQVCVTETEPGQLEFTSPTVNKAIALAHVAERLGVAREEVLAFGDGNNDAPMLEWAGFGVAMSHASAAAQAAADVITPEGDPETSLARAIELVLAARFDNRPA
ncbi:MAG: Cof-type HAD-IIB family hydrolase [Gemmatimonadetes bacterium]|nr:Cof-type HAD-IIB family hydrolase [Gemmatimonadota bacterium]